MLAICASILIPISIIDLRQHRIPNRLVILFLPLWLHEFHLYPFILISSISVFLYLGCRAGAGDVKLFLFSSPLLGSFSLERYLLAISISAMVVVVIRRISMHTKIPLAPSISIATLINI